MSYPLEVKSNKTLLPGQYWAIPLRSGRYACGRVIQLPPKGEKGIKSFLAGLMNWVGDELPTFEDLIGVKTIAQGDAHTVDESKIYPVFPTWGYKVIYILAEEYFGKG